MLFALPKGTSGSLAIRHSDRQAVLGRVKGASKRTVAQRRSNVLLRRDCREYPAPTTSFVTFLPTPFSSETESGFWSSITYCNKRIYPTIRRWRAKCYFHSDGSWGMP